MVARFQALTDWNKNTVSTPMVPMLGANVYLHDYGDDAAFDPGMGVAAGDISLEAIVGNTLTHLVGG